MNESITLDAQKEFGKITLTIHFVGMDRLRFRIALGSKIIEFAAFIMGCGIEIVDEPNAGQ